jgi:3-methylcrotonyl-CoA carboxylase beta subunit
MSSIGEPLPPGARAIAAAMATLVADLRAKIATIALGGPQALRDRHVARGKLLPRQRVEALLDPGTAFLEIGQLAAYEVYDDYVPAAGIIAGVGQVAGRLCVVVANDSTVMNGSYYPLTVKKHLRAQEIAAQNGLACVYLVDSGGANLPRQGEIFPDRDHFGRIFFNQANMSAQGISQIAVVMGHCTAGGAYVPAMADETIIVREELVVEGLGGEILGVADHLANDDDDALRMARSIVATLPEAISVPAQAIRAPLFDTSDLHGLAPLDSGYPVDVHEIIARIVDASELHEFKPCFGETLVTGFAHIEGMPVAILANNGILGSEAAQKGAHFIELACQRRIPLLFLQNISNLRVRTQYENDDIAKHGAKLMMAVACAAVPKITVVTGGSFGTGNYSMGGRAFSPRFLWMWPNARIGIMGGEAAASVLATARTSGFKTKAEAAAFKAPIRDQYERESKPYHASARLWDDGVIDPADTRAVVALSLAASLQRPVPETKFGTFRM